MLLGSALPPKGWFDEDEGEGERGQGVDKPAEEVQGYRPTKGAFRVSCLFSGGPPWFS